MNEPRRCEGHEGKKQERVFRYLFCIFAKLGCSRLKNLLLEEKVKLIIYEEILEEITLVTKRPKLKKYFPADKVDELIKLLQTIGIFITIASEVFICRDAKDNYLLALAKDGNADFLVTGDKDLLIINNFEGTEIVKYQDFLLRLSS